jgi:hypothetical protein
MNCQRISDRLTLFSSYTIRRENERELHGVRERRGVGGREGETQDAAVRDFGGRPRLRPGGSGMMTVGAYRINSISSKNKGPLQRPHRGGRPVLSRNPGPIGGEVK